jgi:transcriptional regulator with XRE-family HTH domain/Zn-dependent peptidase ImmA (M78 family)
MPDMSNFTIGRRLKALREANRLTQTRLAEILNLKDHQSISQIEAGKRRLSAAELVAIVNHFGVGYETLTNPFLLSEKESFSWRQAHVPIADLNAFEECAGEWIGAYRELSRQGDIRLKRLLPRLALTYQSSFEDAVQAGESVADELDLGDAPAFRLREVLEDRLGILVLMVDALRGLSGAACRLPELNAVLINRHETVARQNSDLAHEFFHLLTWDQMKPARIESSEDPWDEPRTQQAKRNQRIEQLCDNFGSGVLMPSKTLDALGEPHGDLAEWLTAAAAEIGVSNRALKWRLANAKRSNQVARVPKEALIAAARARGPAELAPAPLFSKPFVETIAKAIETGHLSGARAASMLRMSKVELGSLCETYGIERPLEL